MASMTQKSITIHKCKLSFFKMIVIQLAQLVYAAAN